MCHEIVGSGETSYYPLGERLIGAKGVRLVDGVWFPEVRETQYRETSTGVFYDEGNEQDIVYQIPVTGGGPRASTSSVRGGMHISPFSRRRDGHSLLSCGIRLLNRDPVTVLFTGVPAVFHPNDVIFFDGKDVSVRCFRFLYYEEAKKFSKVLFGDKYVAIIPIEYITRVFASKEGDDISLSCSCGFPFVYRDRTYVMVVAP